MRFSTLLTKESSHHVNKAITNILCVFLFSHLHRNYVYATSTSSKFGDQIARQPEPMVAPLYDIVQFECGFSLTPDRVEWRFRHANVQDHNMAFVYLTNTNGYNISTVDNLSKLRVNVVRNSIGKYQCVVWFGAAALASVPAKLELASISSDVNYSPLAVTKSWWHVPPGNTVVIHCNGITSNPPPVWNFFKDNHLIPNADPQQSSNALILTSVALADAGTYTCSAVNAITTVGIKSSSEITIQLDSTTKCAPKFPYTPPSQIVAKLGTTVVLECPGVGNPVPKAVWSRPDANIFNNRTIFLSYGLQIANVRAEDRGVYVCLLDNGHAPALIHSIRLEVQEFPVIVQSLTDIITTEGNRLELECIAKGYPIPSIHWLINGNETRHDRAIHSDRTKLIIKSVEKRHAGIVQCFAQNEIGEVYVNCLLEVNPKQISGEVESDSFKNEHTHMHSAKSNFDRKLQKEQKKHKYLVMIPPSQPSVTRLSDERVMVRWSVPEREGLAIQFFKVQYRSFGDGTKKAKRSHWMTTNEDIPPQARMYEVENLKPGYYYRFRIAAVYSNNDNELSSPSAKFLLLRGSELDPIRSRLTAPNLTNVEPISETSVVLHWWFPKKPNTPVDGYYAYYRPASTAGEYSKAIVIGMHWNKFRIDDLEPGTAYEFKLQSFTKSAASDFLAIVTARTLKPSTITPVVPTILMKSNSTNETDSSITLAVEVAGIGLIVFIFSAFLCMKRRKRSSLNDLTDGNNIHRKYIQADSIGYTKTTNGNGRISGLPARRTSLRIQPGVSDE